jgi:hypothetical protein
VQGARASRGRGRGAAGPRRVAAFPPGYATCDGHGGEQGRRARAGRGGHLSGARRRRARLPRRTPSRVRRSPARPAVPPQGASSPPRHGRHARLPARDPGGARGRLAGGAGARRPAAPPRRDHRPDRRQDGHQRAQLGRRRLHGRLRGLELADLAQHDAGPGQPDRGDRRPARAPRPGEGRVPARGRARHAARPPPGVASRREAPADGRPDDVGLSGRRRPVPVPQRASPARPGLGPLPVRPEAREPPRGPAVERRPALGRGRARARPGDHRRHRPRRGGPGRVRDERDPPRAAGASPPRSTPAAGTTLSR